MGTGTEAAIRAGRWVDPDLRAVTFGEFTKSFMSTRRKRGRTVGTRWEKLDTHILPRWADTALGSFTWYEVDAWQQGLTIADVSRGHCVSLMSTILTAAVDAQHITVNPLFGRRRTRDTAGDPPCRRRRRSAATRGPKTHCWWPNGSARRAVSTC
ncbi:hypothetical protein [Streptomyces microflavus]|uniref:hypothetical protein n=1 Tax=Streptomyces microflavus TaxID=1919 RepID=UPI003B213D06